MGTGSAAPTAVKNMSTITSISRRTSLFATAALVTAMRYPALAASPLLKIGTIGAGNIGGTLGQVWTKNGHKVMLSSRNPAELADLVKKLGPNASAGTVEQTVAFADVILLAVPYKAMPQIAQENAKAIVSKVLVIDATNPIPGRDSPVAEEAIKFGAGAYTAKLLPGAHIVRAFNAIGAARFGQGGHAADGTRIGIPIAGDDAHAISIASDLINETGFEPVLVGSLEFGRNLRPGQPLAGEHSPAEIKQIAATLK
jgi:8-hydroxy-5-deazaflavin:NADPH oxidoreductase